MIRLNLNIIKADTIHADVVGVIHSQAWREAYENVFPKDYIDTDTAEVRKEEFFNALVNENYHYYLIYKNEKAIGMFKIANYADVCELLSIYILKDYCGQGIGSEAISFLVELYAQRDIVLWTLESNVSARKFYEKQGFIKTGKSRVINRGVDYMQIQYMKRKI